MSAVKAYRIQIYPSRAVHVLLKELAEKNRQTVSKTAVSLIEQALHSDSVLTELRNVKGAQDEMYKRFMELLTTDVATTSYLLGRTCFDENDKEVARTEIMQTVEALRKHFIGESFDAGN